MAHGFTHPFARTESLTSEYAFILGENVERLRKRKRITKDKLCLMAGVSRPTLDRVIGAGMHTRLSTIVKLAGALDVAPEDLIRAPFNDVPLSAYHRPPRK